MSTGAQVAVLDARGVKHTRLRADPDAAARPLIRLIAFAALGLYGALRWGTMLSPMPTGRMLGLLAVAVALAAAGPALRARSRLLLVGAIVVAVILLFAIAGLPWRWIRHLRFAISADAIDEGLSSLPRAYIPYNGINEWVRMVIVLGGGLLLLLAAISLAFAPRSVGEVRRAAAAVPLVALAIVPSTIVRPQLAYLHGLILFILLVAFVWGERIAGRDGPLAVGIAAVAATAGMIAAPALDEHTPWFDYQSLAGQLSPGSIEAFDWSQRYGPLNWPRTGREILDVAAANPDYWKTESLELFRGTGWETGSTDPTTSPPAPSNAAIDRWSQTIQVTLRAIRTQQIIGAGYSDAPVRIPQAVESGAAAGTWQAPSGLQPGDSYEITTYSPRPSLAQLQKAGDRYPVSGLLANLTMILPGNGTPDQPILFPPFATRSPPVAMNTNVIAKADIDASPYGPVYALAMRLRAHARTPADYVQAVLNYLGHGFVYSETPPPSVFPLVSFLLKDKAGYCQQFAGAMALLLRMGGVPARVATGFTTGDYDRSRHEYVVSDLNAHAWVEAWFPTYGWVRFDPTPGSAPARSGRQLPPVLRGSATPVPAPKPVRRPETAARTSTQVSPATPHPPRTSPLPFVLVALGLIAVIGLVLARMARLREPTEGELVAELERAMVRCKRPLSDGATLAALEHRFRQAPEAAGYVTALRHMRFAGAGAPPTAGQRRALRAELGAGLGPLGRLRALWALPPGWTPHLPRRSTPHWTPRLRRDG
jgi:transglutaminase-like putative cysteine protease